jgi:hypothetical protein
VRIRIYSHPNIRSLNIYNLLGGNEKPWSRPAHASLPQETEVTATVISPWAPSIEVTAAVLSRLAPLKPLRGVRTTGVGPHAPSAYIKPFRFPDPRVLLSTHPTRSGATQSYFTRARKGTCALAYKTLSLLTYCTYSSTILFHSPAGISRQRCLPIPELLSRVVLVRALPSPTLRRRATLAHLLRAVLPRWSVRPNPCSLGKYTLLSSSC